MNQPDTHERLVAVLPDYRRWLGAVARDICGPQNASYHGDLMQEGYIAMWRALQTYEPDKGPLPPYLTWAARMRMVDVARRGFIHWTGRDTMRGGHGQLKVTSVASLNEAQEAGIDVEDFLAAAAVDDVLWGYHEGEIQQALASLTPKQREYVLLRFWGGYTGPELDAYFGTSRSGARTSYWLPASKVLRDKLAHLVSA